MHGGDVWREGAPGDWLDFSANIRPGGAPDWVRAAMLEGLENASYYPDRRMERARAALGKHLGLDADWVLPTAGGISAIALAARLAAAEMILFAPCFGEYAQIAENCGVRVRQLSLLEDSHKLRAPSEALAGNMRAGAAVWLCNPLNPVGIAFPRSEIEVLLEQVEAADGWLVLDEAFIHCCPEHSSVELLRAHPRLVIVGSMTKSLGIPGVRLGCLCAEPALLETLARRQLSWELSCFADAVLRALPEHAEELRAETALNAARREALREGLEALGIYVYPSSACFLLADFGRDIAPIAARLHARGILTRQCDDFPGIDDGHHLRLAVKDEASNARLLAELECISKSRDVQFGAERLEPQRDSKPAF